MSATPVARLIDPGTPTFTYGADYNPEQWGPETWAEDARLMREAGVNLVAINIFGWAQLEPIRDEFDFTTLDAVLDVLHANGIGVNLGTGTSSPPPWLTAEHPESLPMMADGTLRYFGGRQAFCPNSPVYRRRALILVEQVARRYGNHLAVRLWHVSNEIGCHNAHCFCDVSTEAFRVWLQKRHGSLDALNAAWGTAFWSQRYAAWEHIPTPRETISTRNPAHLLDFMRFSSDSLLDLYRAEEQLLREHSDIPVTTNFMVTAHIRTMDYWSWAPHMDLIANDHYLDNRLAHPRSELSFAADLTRGLAGGEPWMLMETATSAVSWQPRNAAKAPGEHVRNVLTHVARGADGVSFFQWRASVQGAEKYHSAMLPHAGTDSKIWRESVEVGALLGSLAEVAGSRVVADVALVFDWQAWWATDLGDHPSEAVRYLPEVHRMHRALTEAGYTVDVVAPGAALDDYRLVVVPALHTVSDAHAAVIADFAAAGGHVVVTFFSGIVDEDDRVRTGGYPGAFRDLLGVSVEEFFPVDRPLTLDTDDTATIWSELVHLTGAEAVARFADGPVAGEPAVTRNAHGAGAAWYLATALDLAPLTALLARVAREAGAQPVIPAAPEVDAVLRRGADADYLFVINHGDTDHETAGTGVELVTGAPIEGTLVVPARAARILRVDSPAGIAGGRDSQ